MCGLDTANLFRDPIDRTPHYHNMQLRHDVTVEL